MFEATRRRGTVSTTSTRRRSRAAVLGVILVALTWHLTSSAAHAAPAPPTPIPPGTYTYHGTWSHSLRWNIGIYSWYGRGDWNQKTVIGAPTGSTQTWTQRTDCPEWIYEQKVDYRPDGIHLLQTYRDTGERPWADPERCATGLSVPQACHPLTAPLILPTGAKPGQRLSYTMACAPESVHRVSIVIVGWKNVTVSGTSWAALVIRTRDDIISSAGTFVHASEDWVNPRNGLLIFGRSRLFSDNLFGFMTGVWDFSSALSTCSSCPLR